MWMLNAAWLPAGVCVWGGGVAWVQDLLWRHLVTARPDGLSPHLRLSPPPAPRARAAAAAAAVSTSVQERVARALSLGDDERRVL